MKKNQTALFFASNSNQIGPNESYRMLLRGVLLGAPPSTRREYVRYIAPLHPGSTSISEGSVTEGENAVLAAFVKDLLQLRVIDLENFYLLPPQIRLEQVLEQRNETLAIALRYTSLFTREGYRPFLKTIMGNIASRLIVDTPMETYKMEEVKEAVESDDREEENHDRDQYEKNRSQFQAILDQSVHSGQNVDFDDIVEEDTSRHLDSFLEEDDNDDEGNEYEGIIPPRGPRNL